MVFCYDAFHHIVWQYAEGLMSVIMLKVILLLEERILDTNARKQLS